MPSRRFGTLSARLVVARSDVDKLQSLPWPEYCYLREWVYDLPKNGKISTDQAKVEKLGTNEKGNEKSDPKQAKDENIETDELDQVEREEAPQ